MRNARERLLDYREAIDTDIVWTVIKRDPPIGSRDLSK
jgi:hypothetical protein